jgi:hypothetical protein
MVNKTLKKILDKDFTDFHLDADSIRNPPFQARNNNSDLVDHFQDKATEILEETKQKFICHIHISIFCTVQWTEEAQSHYSNFLSVYNDSDSPSKLLTGEIKFYKFPFPWDTDTHHISMAITKNPNTPNTNPTTAF